MTSLREPGPDETVDATPTPTYFELPMLKAPHWGTNVIAYLFCGGIMGGLGVLALIARDDREDEHRMRRAAHLGSFALAAINPLLLISHLGRPERFLHMMRIVKVKSPMSLGVWGLVLFSGVAGANAVRELTGLRVAPRILTPLQAVLGAFIAGYTGVLLSATAIPLWGAGKRHIPAACVCSGFSGACALSSLVATIEGNHRVVPKVERLEMLAGAAEFLLLRDFKRSAGRYGKPMFEGERGARLRNYTLLAGIAAPLALNLIGNIVKLPKPVDAARTVLASVLTLVGGYVFRETLIEAGKASARDPHAAFRQPQ